MSLSVLLLSHVQRVFRARGRDRLRTLDLLSGLVDLQEGPWARWWAADVEHAERDGVAPRKAGADLAHKLKPFRKPDGNAIKPRVIKLPDGSSPRGYHLEDFADAFLRYLDATNATNATPLARHVASVASVSSPDQGDEREPGWRRIQREAQETPPRSDTAALASIARVFPKVRILQEDAS
jgi:hypothetical protein